MCKTVYWDLINSNMNRDVQEGWLKLLKYQVKKKNINALYFKLLSVLHFISKNDVILK